MQQIRREAGDGPQPRRQRASVKALQGNWFRFFIFLAVKRGAANHVGWKGEHHSDFASFHFALSFVLVAVLWP
jgi:hypothetical protein